MFHQKLKNVTNIEFFLKSVKMLQKVEIIRNERKMLEKWKSSVINLKC